MGENTVPSMDSGVSCSEESAVDAETSTSCGNICATFSTHYRGARDLRAAKAGAFQEHQITAYAVPFPPSLDPTERDNASLAAQRMEADANNLQHTGHGGQALGAQFVRVEGYLALVLLHLFVLQRRFASLQAAMETISTVARVPSTTKMGQRTSSGVETTPTSDAAEESAPSERQSDSSDGGKLEQAEAVLGFRCAANPTRRRGRRYHFRRDISSPTPPVVDRTQDTTRVAVFQEVEQEHQSCDGRFSQLDTTNPFAMYEPNRLELRSRGQPHPHEETTTNAAVTESPSLTWTLSCLTLNARQACANGYVGEVFSPVAEVSGYLVKLYARCATKGGCAVLSFCAQLCASIGNRAVSWPFRGTLKFLIHHPTCPAKSRLYIVPALQEQRDVTISAVGKTLFSLTGPIPVVALHSEGLWAAGTLRLSISVRA